MFPRTINPIGLFRSIKAPNRDPIPLQSVSVEAKIFQNHAETVLTHQYKNDSDTAIETEFLFPTDENCSIFTFDICFDDGDVIRGKLDEKQRVRDEYDDAIASGSSAATIEETSEGLSCLIGNLGPHKSVTLRLGYVQLLKKEESTGTMPSTMLRFVVPNTLKPKYTPSGAPATEAPSGIQCAHLSTVKFNAQIDIAVTALGPQRAKGFRVVSPSHTIEVSPLPLHSAAGVADEKAEATSASEGVRVKVVGEPLLDRDLVLLVENQQTPASERSNESRAFVELSQDTQSVAVLTRIVPSFPVTETNNIEAIFLIDRSGSMSGTSISLVSDALQLFLKSLPSECRFNIVGFGSSFAPLFPGNISVPYEEGLAKAMDHAKGLRADLGGTVLLAPLRWVLEETTPTAGFVKKIFVLTDGAISNVQEVVALAAKHKDAAQLHTFGIGEGVSRDLVINLAKAGGGSSEFVVSGERMEAKVIRQLKMSTESSLVNRTLDLSPVASALSLPPGSKPILMAPEVLPQLLNKEPVWVHAVYNWPKDSTLATPSSAPVELSLIEAGQEAVTVKNCHIEVTTNGRVLHHMCVKQCLQQMEESLTQRGEMPEIVKSIVDTSVRFGVLTQRTAFIVTKEGSDSSAGPMLTIHIPTPAPRNDMVPFSAKMKRVGVGRGGRGGIALTATPAIPRSYGFNLPSVERKVSSRVEGFSAVKSCAMSHAPASARRSPESEKRACAAAPAARSSAMASFALAFDDKEKAKATKKEELAAPAPTLDPQARDRAMFKSLVGSASPFGTWSLSDVLSTLSLSADIVGRLKSAISPADLTDDLLATLIVLAFFSYRLVDLEDEWSLLAKKSKKALHKVARDEDVEMWIIAAQAVL